MCWRTLYGVVVQKDAALDPLVTEGEHASHYISEPLRVDDVKILESLLARKVYHRADAHEMLHSLIDLLVYWQVTLALGLSITRTSKQVVPVVKYAFSAILLSVSRVMLLSLRHDEMRRSN